MIKIKQSRLKKKRKKEKKKSIFRSWNAPVFCKVVEWLQHWGKKPERWPMEPAFTVFKVPFWNIRKKWKGEGFHTFGARGDCFCWCLAMKSETAKHLLVSKIYVLAAQSFPFKVQTVVLRWERVYVALCYVLQEYRY